MRRLLTIVLLALLPFQFSWAAIASYCEHESNAGQAQHLGHHEHPSHAHSSAPADTDIDIDIDSVQDKAAAAMDADCGHCHGHCAGMLFAQDPAACGVESVRPDAAVQATLNALAPTPPERPQWVALA